MARNNGKAARPVLAAALVAIATTGEAVEKAAGGLLRAIREGGIRDEHAFDEQVRAACEVNGWHGKPGKPKAGSERRAIPHTVRTYLWEIRTALRAGLEVWAMQTMYELRQARQRAGEAARKADDRASAEAAPLPPEVEQDLTGVRVVDPGRPNGALFHDLIATFVALPPDARATFGRQLSRLLHTYQRQVPAAPADARKAAA